MKNLEIRRGAVTIKAEFSPQQWELYENQEGVEYVAAKLNIFLESCVNAGYDKVQTLDVMHQEMIKYADYGSYDSEPIYFLQSVLEEIYG